MAYEFKIVRRVEFSDTDMAGIVHYSNFFPLVYRVGLTIGPANRMVCSDENGFILQRQSQVVPPASSTLAYDAVSRREACRRQRQSAQV